MKSLLNLIIGIALFASSSSFALEADLKAFFKNSEGMWRGHGQVTQMVQGGQSRSTNYLIDFGIRSARENLWRVAMKFVYENGTINTPWGMFQVSGDNLIVIGPQINEPVNVLTAGSNALFYKLNHADPATGRVYQLSYKYAICTDGIFKGETQIMLNEVVVAQEHFEAKKDGASEIKFTNFGGELPEVADFCSPN